MPLCLAAWPTCLHLNTVPALPAPFAEFSRPQLCRQPSLSRASSYAPWNKKARTEQTRLWLKERPIGIFLRCIFFVVLTLPKLQRGLLRGPGLRRRQYPGSASRGGLRARASLPLQVCLGTLGAVTTGYGHEGALALASLHCQGLCTAFAGRQRLISGCWRRVHSGSTMRGPSLLPGEGRVGPSRSVAGSLSR